MTPQAICQALEAGRWIGVIAGFGLALRYRPDSADQLHVLAPWLVGSVSGLTGIESVFLGKAAAQLTGYAPSAYQRQSGMNNLALAARPSSPLFSAGAVRPIWRWSPSF